MVGVGYLGDVDVSEFANGAGGHVAEVASIDEEDLTLAVSLAALTLDLPVRLVLGEEPETHGDARCVEQLGGHGHDALDQVRLDEALPDLTLTRSLR